VGRPLRPRRRPGVRALQKAVDRRRHRFRQCLAGAEREQSEENRHDPALGLALEDSARRELQRAGELPQAQWFRRKPDRSGEGLPGINLETGRQGRRLPDTAFPTYFLREDDDSRPHRQLIQDFLAWQAPCLLLLQNLDTPARRRFERLATSRALGVDKQYRLYPTILDEAAIKAARVEATLRRNEAQEDEQEKALATYYIELNVTRTN